MPMVVVRPPSRSTATAGRVAGRRWRSGCRTRAYAARGRAAIRYAADTLAHEEVVFVGEADRDARDQCVRFLADESCEPSNSPGLPVMTSELLREFAKSRSVAGRQLPSEPVTIRAADRVVGVLDGAWHTYR
jgi:hypothetical protein